MRLQISESDEGAFSTVILDRAGSRAFKLFKSQAHPGRIGSQKQKLPDEKCRRVFSAELQAYQIIRTCAELQEHTPRFLGATCLESVTDRNGEDVSQHYLLDCCYCMGLCEGQAVKIETCLSSFPHLEDFIDKLGRRGVRFTSDSSVFSPESADGFIFIDFATHNAAEEYELEKQNRAKP
ncbi:MAG TPA: hypothetical protein PK280_19125 [Planctomycetota bacterium]|nr:hypothetical protein [Planctomycetota bacterium]